MFHVGQSTRVDDKGRLKLSADFKAIIDEQCGPKFFITTVDGKRAQLFPWQEWTKRLEIVNSLPASNVIRQKINNLNARYGALVEMDSAGRLLLPLELRTDAKLTAEVRVVPQGLFLEVANEAEFLETAQPLTAEEQAQAEALGL
jgi:MraZ protein